MPYYHQRNIQHHPESLLVSLPGGGSEQDPMNLVGLDWEEIRQLAAQGNISELRSVAGNRTWITTHRYCGVGDGVDFLEQYLHDLWHVYYQAGRYLSHKSPEHDSMVLDILRIKGKGPLSRPVRGVLGVDVARTKDGTLWNDLPFFVSDMVDFWINGFVTMSVSQRVNLSTFLAKLASTRICKDRLCQIALFLFRATLENGGRELRSEFDSEDEDPIRTMDRLTIATLLPSVHAWIDEAGDNLVQLADVSWNDCPNVIGRGGGGFKEWEVAQQPQSGFTPWRWIFWVKRLSEIKEEAAEAGDKKLEEDLAETIERMLDQAEERNSHVLRVYENGPPALREDKHLRCLRKVLKRMKVEDDSDDDQQNEDGKEESEEKKSEGEE
ncbi:DUF3632 domain-containing protein [Aspergillus mulundensis]|uniref:Uncharacterized protein n=1 Tax=Aspergillus mulundensis TaxID=1810919 RepID=A0A3D8R906_9EURO|nr:Uncharacterized protein DSM5745_08053 [Aspergillus mulundensis]RDW70542.1 Uncharacterized protein DSM5745_08053 [Aspergillus mulundensis]